MKTISAAAWKRSNAASVGAVGIDIPVEARGSAFYNRGRWTARCVVGEIAEWISLNVGEPTLSDLREACRVACDNANAASVKNPGIVVATVPDRVTPALQRASVGGNYHEAAHSLYSCQRDLRVTEIFPPLSRRLRELPMSMWGLLTEQILTWGNLIEDIRIERVMCREFPGAREKLEALQDLILLQEGQGNAGEGHKTLPKDDLRVVMGSFRDLGLGYQTSLQRAALEEYQTASPAAYRLVAEGDLKPLLDRAKALTKDDDLGHWWLALEVIAVLVKANQTSNQPPQDQQDQGQQDQGQGQGQQDQGQGQDQKPQDQKQPKVWKVGDRAMCKSGRLAGKKVQVIFAGLPEHDGRQEVRFAEVVED